MIKRIAAMLAAAAGSAALAGPTTWSFDVSTSGEDVHWISPTAVDPNAASYLGEYQITQVIATVLVFGIPTDFDVTDQIAPEDLSGSGENPGPAPITLIEEVITYPEPPEPPAVAAELFVGLDAAGHGVLDAANITLGSIDLGFPFGVVDIVGFAIAGQITVTPSPPSNPADVNGDGTVDVLDLVLIITTWGVCPPDDCPGDVDGDGMVGVPDLVAVITGWG